jgi:diketogulonate reductase-like aldo/keto reductase
MSIPAAVTLNSGARMPFLAIGTGASSLTAMQQTLLDALELGYTHVDTGASSASEIGTRPFLRPSLNPNG